MTAEKRVVSERNPDTAGRSLAHWAVLEQGTERVRGPAVGRALDLLARDPRGTRRGNRKWLQPIGQVEGQAWSWPRALG